MPAAKLQKRIFIIHRQVGLRNRLKQALNRESDLEVCAVAESASAALPKLKELKPELVIIGDSHAIGNNLRSIRSACGASLKTLVISRRSDPGLVAGIMRMGADGFELEATDLSDVILAVEDLLNGYLHVSERVLRKSSGPPRPKTKKTNS